MIDVGQHLFTSLRAHCSLLPSMCVELARKTIFHLFLLHLCPGFASLIFPAHFLKSPSRTLQPAQPPRTHTDQRCARTQTQMCTRAHAHTHTPPHSIYPLPFLLPYRGFPFPTIPGRGARYLSISFRLQLRRIWGQPDRKALTKLNTADFSSSRSMISIQMHNLNAGNTEWRVTVPPLQAIQMGVREEEVKRLFLKYSWNL